MRNLKEISGWLIILAVVLASCHTERKTQRIVGKAIGDPVAFNTLGMYWQLQHPCANDSTSKTDSIFIQGRDVVKTDTLRSHDTVYINTVVHKTDTLKQKVTNTVVDTRAVQQAKDSATKYKALYEASQSQLKGTNELHQQEIALLKSDQAKVLKAEKKRGNRWMWKFWGLAAAFGLWIFRKPILTFLSGGWSKLIGIFK